VAVCGVVLVALRVVVALVDCCYVVVEDDTNDPPREQWLTRLDLGVVSFVFVVVSVISVHWPARSSIVTKDPPHEQGLMRLGLGHC
jgi:heme/copper-type cytochrome/quinol oxidase subunit 2